MKKVTYITLLHIVFSIFTFSQENTINITATLHPEKDEIWVQQKIVYHNHSKDILKKIYLHNWPNSFKNRKTPLSKRFIEDFKKNLYFAKTKELGYTTIKNLTINYNETKFNELKNKQDILEIHLKKPLQPKDSALINTTYIVKIPSAKFTNYGKTDKGYHLRFWYLTPAVYNKEWQLMSNLNLDDLYENCTDFTIDFTIPKNYFLESNLYKYKTNLKNKTNYYLVGKHKTDVIIGIHKTLQLKTFKTPSINIHTDVFSDKVDEKLGTTILNREIAFIEKYLGKYPHVNIYIDKATQRKEPIYGLNQLPKFLSPFSNTFKWDLTMFKALTKRYIENTLLLNKRKEYWLLDAIQNYLLIEYVEKYYPKTKLIGKVSEKWIINKFNLAKLSFNDKYPFVYQFSARKFLDQSLTTSADSLSNFNKKIVSKYKAGLGFRYLKGYVGDTIFNKTLKEFYQKNKLAITSTAQFNKLLSSKTNKNLDWFFGDYIKTNKKIDYTIEKITQKKDSLVILIKNKRNITTPVALYALKGEEIKLKKWITKIDSSKTITIKNGDFTKLALNYENIYPEYNTLDNWKNIKKKIFNKPLKFTFYKDISKPDYNQLFYKPNVSYNFYNGVILGLKLNNKPIIKRNLVFELSPAYATKSANIVGNFSVVYNQFFEKTNIYKIAYGLAGGTQDYAPNLAYKSFSPFINLTFKRKTLRETSSRSVNLKLININKEVPAFTEKLPEDKYSILSLSYNYSKPDIIKEFRYNFRTEFAKDFTKASADLRWRSLTSSDTQLDFRLFAGTFFTNNTTGNYFSFGLDRSNDYLFQLNYYGRSESSGFFSQQFIISEGGFKSVLPTRFANQYMVSFNSSIGFWKWAEIYNDVAFLKNKNQPIYFAYENGIRFNFIHEVFEIYFPLYSNNGWEITQNAYSKKIRFTLTTNFGSIINFFRRGFF